MACRGSVALGIDIPDPPPNEAAIEGTKIHEEVERLGKMSDLEMQYGLLKLAAEDEDTALLIKGYLEFCWNLSKAFTHDFKQVVSDTDPSYRYADEHQFKSYIEKKFHLTENIWGTADRALVGKRNGKMEVAVVDLKTGGYQVEAKDNPQLIIYGLGICKELGIEPDKLRLYIYQPRGGGDTVRKAVLEKEEIEQWKEKINIAEHSCLELLKYYSDPLFRCITSPIEDHLNPGNHCRWCKCAPTCPALHEQSLALITPVEEKGLGSLRNVPIENLVELYKRKEQIENLLNGVQAFILRLMESGIDVPGMKLVKSRGKRSWAIKNKNELASKLLNLGLTEEQVYKKSIINLGDAEKLLGKDAINDLVSLPIERHMVVPVTDGRQEINNLNLIEAIETND